MPRWHDYLNYFLFSIIPNFTSSIGPSSTDVDATADSPSSGERIPSFALGARAISTLSSDFVHIGFSPPPADHKVIWTCHEHE